MVEFLNFGLDFDLETLELLVIAELFELGRVFLNALADVADHAAFFCAERVGLFFDGVVDVGGAVIHGLLSFRPKLLEFPQLFLILAQTTHFCINYLSSAGVGQ